MDLRNKKKHNRKDKIIKKGEELHSLLDPREVKQYEKGRAKKGARFGKKWFPENKSD